MKKNFEEFSVAGKNQGLKNVLLSLLSTMVGASATIGVADRVYQIGFCAFWWLGVGAIGLLLQGCFLSKKIRELNANTLPDIACKTIGKKAAILVATIIVISWIGIIAAQFVSVSKIIQILFDGHYDKIVILIAGIVILYTVVGGQLSVVKTDVIQSIFILLGIIASFVYLYAVIGGERQIVFQHIQFLSSDFSIFQWIILLFITGGSYFMGPDIISRNLMSKDKNIARKAVLIASLGLFFFSLIITFISMWAYYSIDVTKEMNPLIYLMKEVLPLPISILLFIALVFTLISSADTCLINAATIIEHDLIGRKNINRIRLFILLIGITALWIALERTDIIGLLLNAYSIYAPGIVFPLTVAIFFHKIREINQTLWFVSVIVGSLMGILYSCFEIGCEWLPLAGMGCSLGISLLSVGRSKNLYC